MTRKYFGTDGVRGTVGVAPITPDFVMRLGYAAGRVLARKAAGSDRPAVLIGKDTRVSGYMLESALEAGLSAAGVDVLLVGPMPTPGVAYLTRALRLSAGIVISASHNPHQDNGIKFFSAAGAKLADATESAIEAALEQPVRCAASGRLGKARRVEDAAGRYIEFCKSTFPANLDLRGLRIALDCAHGAAYHIAPHVFHELGADVVSTGIAPDGFNINRNAGATHPESLQRSVRRAKADIGISLDGDGDRLIMCDAGGRIYDGDELLYVIAAHRKRTRALRGGVVGTQMTNLAMAQALKRLRIPFARAQVGDRYVLEMLHARSWSLGGENSGHIVCLDRHTTGDGIVSALQVLHALLAARTTLAKAVDFKLYPQVLINVRLGSGAARSVVASAPVQQAVAAAERALGASGRVLLRPSGTEPVIRVMVEGQAKARVRQLAGSIAKAVAAAS
ncbi:MAG: phosphoglucosamine mutase [Betaproteobacteria bacterium]|jgi:phosphoglucosamine mutase|nr:phosphoglucosamine mutase [Betaproteobacteria bacterium]MDH5342374.1 phosphoglucosamine mutase [Betaproteobacteria bacterium]